MGYPREQLNENEEIVTDVVPHWTFVAGAISMVALALLVTIGIAIVQIQLAWVGVACIVIALIGSLGRILRWRTTHFILTTERLIIQTGIISKNGLEIPLDRVTNIAYRQNLMERILGSGDVVVESAGDMGHQRFTDIYKPQRLQAMIYKYAELDEEGDKSTKSDRPVHNDSIPDQIEKLDQLRQRGVLSDREFQDKKQKLLDRL